MLGPDLLTEIGVGGLYYQGFCQLPPSALSSVEVLPIQDVLALLPTLPD
jgi:hypothetical protein